MIIHQEYQKIYIPVTEDQMVWTEVPLPSWLILSGQSAMPGTGARAVRPGLRRMIQLHAGHRSAYWNPSTPECDLKSVFSLSQFQMIRASCQTWGTCCNPSIKENDLALCQIQGIYYNPGLRIITISRTGTGRLKIQGKPGLCGKFWCT